MNNRGQFTIIAALLVAIILAGTLIAVYATIRYDSSQSKTPQTLTATDETNSALLKALGFTVGYYGSILQVTGNQTYAYDKSTIYMNSALQYIASMNPSLGEAINMTSLKLSTTWFSNPSISTGTLSVVYDLADLNIYGVNYTTSCSLGVQIFNSPSSNQVCVNVTQDLTEPLTSLGQQNFAFYFYNYTTTNWQLINPSLTPTIFTNGTYLINVPSEVTSAAFMVQVTDSRGIIVEASSFNSYNLNFAFSAQSSPAPTVVELLQNGTMLWSGQDLLNTTQAQPIPPVPVSSLNLCQSGSTSDIPFQVEDWASGYQIPLGLTSNYTIFSDNQMIVFEVNPSMSKLTLWWNGSDTAIQPSAAYTDMYFTGDNSGAATLSNGNITLQFSYPNGIFQVTATVGNSAGGKVISTADFMRIDADHTSIGSGSPAYVIQKGVIRDIVQEEAEWSNGPTTCPNVYSQMVLTLPANATYYTYQLRLIFINSTVARNINDISPIQLTTSISQPRAMTENGITTNGIPIVSTSNTYFTNSTGSAHHWSELINGALQGTGIMFTASANQQLYAFDKMAGKFTGALYANSAATPPVIELDPVTSAGPVSFTSALDLTWYGAVVTFNGVNPIYATSGNSGLWPLVEQPPTVAITPQSSAATSINLSPSCGNVGASVKVLGGGFIPNSQITITFNGKTVATTTANVYGEIPLGTTFVIPSYPFGSYTVTATDTSSNSASTNFVLTPLDHFTVTALGGGNISTQTAGTAFSITITAKDSSGNTVTSYTQPSTLSVSIGTISPTSTGEFTNGVWTGQVTLTQSGTSISISTAEDGKNGQSNTFGVNAGAAARFVVSGFTDPVTAGTASSVTVTAYDAYGNVATGYAGTVKITSSDSQAVLPANAGLTNGVGSFSVTLETAGSQSITATDTVTSSITGSQTGITVNPALAAPTASASAGTVDRGQTSALSSTTVTTGTSPYSYQWLEEAPGATTYSSISGATSNSYSFVTSGSTTTGTYSFELKVTDSASTPTIVTSNAVTVKVNSALAAPTASASAGTVDRGQTSALSSTTVTTGTSPYSYQWLEEAPGATTYSSISGATSNSYSFVTSGSTTTGTYSFELKVTDSASTPTIVTSNAVTVKVNSALAAPTASASKSTVDQGQTSALSSTTVTTGTSPYSYQWLEEAPSAGSYSSINGAISNSYSFATSGSTATGTWSFELQVTDSASIPVVVTSTAVSVVVNVAPTVSVSPASWTMDVGQSQTFSATASGGSGSYSSYQWYVGGVSQSGKTASTFSYSPASAGSYSITVTVTDSLGATSAQSTAATVTVNSKLVAPTLTATPTTVDQGQTSSLTSSTVSTGTSPYTYQWLEEAPSGSYVDVGTNSASFSFVTTTSTATGTWHFELQVTDAAGVVVTSSAVTVTVNT